MGREYPAPIQPKIVLVKILVLQNTKVMLLCPVTLGAEGTREGRHSFDNIPVIFLVKFQSHLIQNEEEMPNA